MSKMVDITKYLPNKYNQDQLGNQGTLKKKVLDFDYLGDLEYHSRFNESDGSLRHEWIMITYESGIQVNLDIKHEVFDALLYNKEE